MQYKQPNENDVTSQGMVLITVLLLLTVMNILISYLFGKLPIHLQLVNHWLKEAQQFEAAEVGLHYGERQLAQTLANNPVHVSPQPLRIPSLDYTDYHINLTVHVKPHTFCLLPTKREGHYYQIIACAKPKYTQYSSTICLQSMIALPDGATTCKPNLTERWEGRSAWCQLETG